jgi:hypothetical protein
VIHAAAWPGSVTEASTPTDCFEDCGEIVCPLLPAEDDDDDARRAELVDALAQRREAGGVVRRVPIGAEAEVDAVDPQVLPAGVHLAEDVLDGPA